MTTKNKLTVLAFCILAFLSTSVLYSQTVLINENFESGWGGWQTISLASDKDWEIRDYYGKYYAYANGYRGNEGSSDWLVSPKFDFLNYKDIQFQFETAKNYSGPDLMLKISTDFDGGNDPSTAAWTDISHLASWSGGSWNWVSSGIIDLDEYRKNGVYLAFHYISNGGAAAWEVTGINIQGTKTASYPSPWILENGPFSFNEWNKNSPAGSYPPHMIFRQTMTRDPQLNDEMDSDWKCPYNFTSRSRITGKGSEGFAFNNTSSTQYSEDCAGAGYAGASVLALNTENRASIEVKWDAYTHTSETREYSIALQYRVGRTGDFQNQGDVYVMNAADGHKQTFTSLLPPACENQPYIEVRWKYYYSGTTTGGRPEMGVDDIYVTSIDGRGAPTKLKIANVWPEKPMAGVPFSFDVISVDDNGDPKAVSQHTEVSVYLSIGSGGTLEGIPNLVISAGQNSVSFDGITYSIPDYIGIRAKSVSGVNLDEGVERILVIDEPAGIQFEGLYDRMHAGSLMPEFNVVITDETGMPYEKYHDYGVTLEILSGPGNMNGSLVKTVKNGTASFDDISFDTPGTYILRAFAPGLVPAVSFPIEVKDHPELYEILIPQFVKGDGDFGERLPSYAMVQIQNLHPNTTYRFTTGGRQTGYSWGSTYDPQLDAGAGNNIHFDENAGDYHYNSGRNLANPGEFSTFTTGPFQDFKTIWINIIPTNNSSFNAGNDMYWIINLANEFGGDVYKLTTANTSKCLDFGPTDDKATGIADKDSWLEPKSIIALYNTDDASGMPLSTAIIQDDGAEIITPGYPHQGPEYFAKLDGAESSWSTLLPNDLPTGVRSIRLFDRWGNPVRTWTDDDGIWAGVSTVNLDGGMYSPLDNFDTPQILITNPPQGGDMNFCDGAVLKWEYHGVSNVDIFYELNNSGVWELLFDNVNAGDMEKIWQYPRGFFDKNIVSFRAASDEHPYINSESGDSRVWDSPEIEDENGGGVFCEGDDIRLSIVASGSNIKYQWFKDGVELAGETEAVLILTDAFFDISGLYHCEVIGEKICEKAKSKYFPVHIARETVITDEPENQSVNIDGTARFSFKAHVNGIPDDYHVDIQWFRTKNGTDEELVNNTRIAGAQSDILSIKKIRQEDLEYEYFAHVIGLCQDAWTEKVKLNLTDSEVEITVDSDNIAACKDEDADLHTTVTVTNYSGKIEMNWKKDGVFLQDGARINGAASEDLSILGVLPSDAGTYILEVNLTDINLTAESDPIMLTVSEAPVFVNQPPPAIQVEIGKELVIAANAAGTEPISYEWYRDGYLLAGFTTSTFTLNVQTTEDGGAYKCKAVNTCGEVYSDECIVTITSGGISSVDGDPLAGGYFLANSEPNPVTGAAKIGFALPKYTHARLVLSDAAGKETAVLFEGSRARGYYEEVIDIYSLNLPAGTYFYTLRTPDTVITRKLAVVK